MRIAQCLGLDAGLQRYGCSLLINHLHGALRTPNSPTPGRRRGRRARAMQFQAATASPFLLRRRWWAPRCCPGDARTAQTCRPLAACSPSCTGSSRLRHPRPPRAAQTVAPPKDSHCEKICSRRRAPTSRRPAAGIGSRKSRRPCSAAQRTRRARPESASPRRALTCFPGTCTCIFRSPPPRRCCPLGSHLLRCRAPAPQLRKLTTTLETKKNPMPMTKCYLHQHRLKELGLLSHSPPHSINRPNRHQT
jgi:hypothetical protein